MKIAVVGTGYVGLVSGVCLAAKGHDVVCVDIEPTIVERLNRGEATIHERGLPELLSQVLDSGRFCASLDLESALERAEIAIVAVGTPSHDGAIDLTYIRAVARRVGEWLQTIDRHVSIVVKSTVTPGTTDTVVREELEKASGKRLGQFGLGMNPEFLREGEAIADFMDPDRIVIGHEDEITLARLTRLYAPWDVEKLAVNTRTAELIKYANNALLATQISAVNELANLAAAVGGIDIMDVMAGVHLDRRWNPVVGGGRVNPAILTYLVPGCGFGGSCFPKDVQALRARGGEVGVPMSMLDAVLRINAAQPNQVADILERATGPLMDRRVLLLGLAFKPDTDDVRQSASISIARDLLARGCRVSAHDPIAAVNFARAVGSMATQISFVQDWKTEIAQVGIVVVATRWSEYASLRNIDLRGKIVFDARRLLKRDELSCDQYLSIGQGIMPFPVVESPDVASSDTVAHSPEALANAVVF